MLRWPDYFADPPNATTSGDVNSCALAKGLNTVAQRRERCSLRASPQKAIFRWKMVERSAHFLVRLQHWRA